jgi:hypothetical protein
VTPHEVLVKARNRLARRHGWHGRRVHLFGDARCAGLAISDAAGGYHGAALRAFYAATGEAGAYAGPISIYRWNDAPGRTKKEVLAAFDRAIAATAPAPADPFGSLPVEAEKEEAVA